MRGAERVERSRMWGMRK